MADEQWPHIQIEGYFDAGSFQSPRGGGSEFGVKQRARREHGAYLQEHFSQAVETFEENARQQDEELYDEDIIYLEFESEPGFIFKTDSFDDGWGRFRLSYSKTSRRVIGGEEVEVQKIGIFINKKGVAAFLGKVEDYLNPDKDTPETERPRHQPLLANIAEIRAATLECFWTDFDAQFPDWDEEVWWEVWLRRDNLQVDNHEEDPVKEVLQSVEASIGDRRILFPEHIVILVRATANQLSRSLLYTSKLSELRQPKETAEFFLREEIEDQRDWIVNFVGRIDDHTTNDSTLVCILDSGVNRGHPLLQNFLGEANMHTVNPDWGTADSWDRGHGTQMAGTSLFGDLVPYLEGSERVQLYHKLESVKLINPNDPHDVDLYGAVTIEAVSQPILVNPDNKRIYCMAITAPEYEHRGEPSSWSSAVDSLIFGSIDDRNQQSLFLVSAGSLSPSSPEDYKDLNDLTTIHDPAQACNALTIGAITNKDIIDQERHPGARPLAPRGELSPYSCTGITMDKQWANKPDLVFEGGNLGIDNQGIIEPDSLKLLTVGHDPERNLLSDHYGTSAATALASRFAADLYSEYPNYRPETIRALMIHSSSWTDQMRQGHTLDNTDGKRNLLRTYGYGMPNLEKARYSASNRLTIIAERAIQPYIREGSNNPKINEVHVYELPWPREVLEELFDQPVRLNVTLSYFIEPNPGRKEYSQSYSYHSYGLRFKMSKPGELKEDFAARINKEARDENYQSDGSERWVLGPTARDKGSIHRDWWMGTAAELAAKNLIAVFPVSGWWKTRYKLERFMEQARYSLIVSIDASEVDVDLYTPVMNQVGIDIEP